MMVDAVRTVWADSLIGIPNFGGDALKVREDNAVNITPDKQKV